MRGLFIVCCAVLGCILVALSLPRFMASMARAPGSQAIGLASSGQNLRPQSFERALQSLERSLVFFDQRHSYVELVIVNQNFGRQNHVDDARRRQFYTTAFDALNESMRFSPVEPTGWLLAAQMHHELGERAEAAEALSWSLRTARYLHHLSNSRTLLGMDLWALLDEESRSLLMDSIASTFVEAPEVFVAWAVELGVDDAVATRLEERGFLESELAAQFREAVDLHREQRETALAAQEIASMQRLRAAAVMFATAALPVFGEAMTIEQYLNATRDESSFEEDKRIDDYLVGVVDGIVMFNSASAQQSEAFFCLPQQDFVSVDMQTFRRDLDLMLERFAEEVPGFDDLARTRTMGLAALQLMSLQYPCEQE